MPYIKIKTAIPGPKSIELLERRKQAVTSSVSISRNQIFVQSAKGALITDVDGNTFIDFAGGIGCMNIGHSDPRVIAAVKKQVEQYQHLCFQVNMYEPYVALCEKLVAIAPGRFPKKAALFNSGAEAIENTVKIARRFTGRQAIVCFENAFHGRTLLTLSLTSKVKPYKDGFGPFAPEIYQTSFPYLYRRPEGLSEEAYVKECISQFHRFLKSTVAADRIAAIILEPELGEGGFMAMPAKFIADVVEVCQKHGIVLITDEIQAGFGRTGKMFSCEHFGLEPGLIAMAKSMSGGFPLSAVVGKAEIMDAVPAGGIGTTFGGNPVACAAALAALEVIEQDHLCDRANKIGAIIKDRMTRLQREVKCIGDVRGLGAMIGIELVKNGKEPDKEATEKAALQCAKQGVLFVTAGVEGNIIRSLMPLCISDEQLNEALDVMENVLRGL